MLEETRLHRIQALINTLKQVTTEQLVQHLGVSRETVRRDILKLEAIGVLRRVHGGVVSAEATAEPPLSVRNTVQEREKQQIARAAVDQLHPGQTLFIDAGSTTAKLAKALLSMPGMTIITNSLSLASNLGNVDTDLPLAHEVILLGGQLGMVTQATAGAGTVREISRYRADIALLSPVGIHSEDGVSSFSHHEAAVAEAMVRHAKQTVILADHSKVGVTSREVYADINAVDLLITDAQAAQLADFEALKQRIEVLLV